MVFKRLVAMGLVVATALGLSGCNPESNNANYVRVLNKAGAATSWCSGAEHVPKDALYLQCGTDTTTWRCETYNFAAGTSGIVAESRCEHPGGSVDIAWFSYPDGDIAVWNRYYSAATTDSPLWDRLMDKDVVIGGQGSVDL